MTGDILPDSRAKVTRGQVFRGSQTWLPIFCANCGKEGGLVTESCTFAFWICHPCEKTYGRVTGLMRVPDSVFYDRMHEAQIEHAGRPMTHDELLQVQAEDCSPLATLMKEAK